MSRIDVSERKKGKNGIFTRYAKRPRKVHLMSDEMQIHCGKYASIEEATVGHDDACDRGFAQVMVGHHYYPSDNDAMANQLAYETD